MRKVIIYFIFFPLFLSGQESISSKKSDMTADFYLSVFDVIDKYEKNCRFSKLSRYNDFENLFTDSSSSVYNDIIPSSSFMKNVSPRQYISEVRRLERKRLTVDIDVLEVGEVYAKSTNSGMIDVYVSKYMKARFDDNSANIIYEDIKEFIDWEHTIGLTIQLVYQDLSGNDMSVTLHNQDAGVAQHEVDHLFGMVFLDRLSSKKKRQVRSSILQKKKLLMDKKRKLLKKEKIAAELKRQQEIGPPRRGFRIPASNPIPKFKKKNKKKGR